MDMLTYTFDMTFPPHHQNRTRYLFVQEEESHTICLLLGSTHEEEDKRNPYV